MIYASILGFAKNEQVQWLQPFQNDKQLHLFVFFVLSFLVYFVWRKTLKKNVILSLVMMYLISIVSECVQSLLPYRDFDWNDINCNLIGSSIGVFVAVLVDYLVKKGFSHSAVQSIPQSVNIV